MPGPLTLGEIASRLGGRVAGDPRTRITQVGSLERAGPGQITFLSSPRYKTKLATTRAAAVILGPEMEGLTTLPRIVCEHPYAYFARLSQLFNPLTVQAPGVHPSAVVAPTARLGKRISIGPHCVVGDDVEIGDNTTIDRGALDDTVLEEGVKLDNQIQIGHNVRVGAHTAMAGCVAVAGSADIGKRCTLGAAAVILGHLSIADDVHVSAGTVISRSIRKAGTYTGMFPFDENASWARNTALVRHLAELAERLRALERKGKDNG